MYKLFVVVLFFFFSSRRRHTRYWRDWSSDVCSSDLHPAPVHEADAEEGRPPERLAADKDVPRHRHLRDHRRVLVDRLDPEPHRLLGRVQVDLAALDEDPPRVGPVGAGEDLDEGG